MTIHMKSLQSAFDNLPDPKFAGERNVLRVYSYLDYEMTNVIDYSDKNKNISNMTIQYTKVPVVVVVYHNMRYPGSISLHWELEICT